MQPLDYDLAPAELEAMVPGNKDLEKHNHKMEWGNDDDDQISLPDLEEDVIGYHDFDWTTQDI